MSAQTEPPQAHDAEPGPTRRWRPDVSPGRLLERFGLPLAWLIVIAVFGALRPDTFLTSANFSTIFGSQAVLVVLTLGLLVVLTAGDFDLSIAGVLSLSAMLVAVLNAQHGWPVLVAIVIALCAGAFVGAINGLFVVVFGSTPSSSRSAPARCSRVWCCGSATRTRSAESRNRSSTPCSGTRCSASRSPSTTASRCASCSGTCSSSRRWAGGCCSSAAGGACRA